MAKQTHPCKAPGCSAEVDYQYLMCRVHWAQVPPAVQRAVNEYWQLWRKTKSREAETQWRHASDLAIRSVAGAIEER